MERDMIKIVAFGNHEIETDCEKIIRKTVKELNKKGKVEGKDFFVTEIAPGRAGKDTKPRP